MMVAGALVAYHGRPALVAEAGSKLELMLPDGHRQSVREKDVEFLHPGPVQRLPDDAPLLPDPQGLQLLEQEGLPAQAAAEILYGAATPEAAWSVWRLCAEAVYLERREHLVWARPAEEAARLAAEKAERAAARERERAFLERAKAGRLNREADAAFIADMMALAEGKTTRSNAIRLLKAEQQPDVAHALLLQLQGVDERYNPHPARLEVPAAASEGSPRTPSGAELVDWDAIAIDDADCPDPDDALAWDGERLWVLIADVTAVLDSDGIIEAAARQRGSTCYLPEGSRGMLPPAVEAAAALLPGERQALAVGLDILPDGSLGPGLVRRVRTPVRALSYVKAEALLESSLAPMVQILEPFSRARLACALPPVQLPEVRPKLVKRNIVLERYPALKSRELVQEAMLAAGCTLAAWARAQGAVVPYAVQAKPQAALQPGMALHHQFARLKQMAPSAWALDPGLHAGTGLTGYTRATSPLRRYADLVVHQQVDALLRGVAPMTRAQLSERLQAADPGVRRARKAERLSNQHFLLSYLRQQAGWKGEAVIVDRDHDWAVVLLPELGLQSRLRDPAPPGMQIPVKVGDIDLPRLEVHLRRA